MLCLTGLGSAFLRNVVAARPGEREGEREREIDTLRVLGNGMRKERVIGFAYLG